MNMTRTQLTKMIEEVTADIRLYQRELGGHIVFDPSSEAARLCDTKLALQRELARTLED